MKKWKVVMCVLLCGFLLKGSEFEAKADKSTSDSITEMQQQIDKAQKERDEIKNSLSDVKGLVKRLEKEKTDLKNYILVLDQNMVEIEATIEDLKDRIILKQADIEAAELRLDNALASEQSQYEAMEARIRYSYLRGDSYFMDMLMQAEDFGDFLNRSEYVNAILEYDNLMLDTYIQTRKYIEVCKEQLEEDKLVLEEAEAGVENEQAALEELIEQKRLEIEKYENSIAANEAAIKEYEADIKAQNELISALEKAVAEERRKLLEANNIKYDGGMFKFPLETYTRVSDDYGDRIHPTLKTPQFHNGVDFASPKGTAIYAAYDGVVVAAAYSSTMGNYVMIDHGSGLYTIYMHASKLITSKDKVVVKGEKIAEVGSTGRSTGNHLHFSVRKDGAYTSPWNYLKK